MREMLVFSLSILNLSLNILSCLKIGPIEDFLFGQRLVHALITRKTSVDFVTCVKHCVHMRSCRSVNYMETCLLCELNYKNTTNEDANITVTSNVVYSERSYWKENKLLSDSCKRKSCPKHTECIKDQNDHASCVVADCGLPIEEEHAEYDLENGIGLYSKVTFKCEDDFYMKGKPYIGCQDNGKWSPARFQCLPVCETGWQHFDHFCYKVPGVERNFWKAKTECENEGAILTDVLSKKESDFIWTLSGEGRSVVLFGGIYDKGSQMWKWLRSDMTFDSSSGTGLGLYTNWEDGQPNYSNSENCMGLYFSKQWHDWECTLQTHFVCKKPTQVQ